MYIIFKIWFVMLSASLRPIFSTGNDDSDNVPVECTTPNNIEVPEGLCLMDGLGGYSEACYSYKKKSLFSSVDSISESTECLSGIDFEAFRLTLQNDTPLKRSYVPTIEVNRWSSSAIQSSIFRILLEEMLGFKVLRVLYRPDERSFMRRAKDETCQAINLELWQNIQSSQNQVVTQPLGVVGRKGLYVPKSTPVSSSHFQLLQLNLNQSAFLAPQPSSAFPEITSPYDFFPSLGDANLTDIFTNRENYACNNDTPSIVGWTNSSCMNGSWVPPLCNENEECKELYLDDPESSLGWFEAIVKNLGLKFRVVYLGIEGLMRRVKEAHIQLVEGVDANEDGTGVVYYWWEPHPLHEQFPSRRLIVPEYSEKCGSTYSSEPMESGVDCDHESRALLKALPAGLKQSEPDLYALWNSFKLTNAEQMEMMMLQGPSMGGSGNLTVEAAACEWLRTTQVDWFQWLSVTVSNTTIAGETLSESSDKFTFSLLELILLCLLLFMVLVVVGVGIKSLFGYFEKDLPTSEHSVINLESPIEKAIVLLSNMIDGKKVGRQSMATLKQTLQVCGDDATTPDWEEQLLNSDNDYSKEGILYLLDMQTDKSQTIRTMISSSRTMTYSEGAMSPQRLARQRTHFSYVRSVQETLQNPSLPWTWIIHHSLDWDFFGAFQNLAADVIHEEELSSGLEELLVDVGPRRSWDEEFCVGRDFNFDTVNAVPRCNWKPLATFGMIIFNEQFDLVNRLGLDASRLWNFFVEVENGYLATNPYHNNTHAADVTHRFATILTVSRMRATIFSDLEVLAGLIAAVIHDYLHPGTNNAFQVAVGAPVAILHNDSHVLENHSAMRGLMLLKGEDTETNFLSSLTKAQRRRVRDIVVGMILATDMSEHFNIVSSFKSKVLPKLQTLNRKEQHTQAMKGGWTAFRRRMSLTKVNKAATTTGGASVPCVAEPLNADEKLILLKMALKCADIGHVTLPMQVHMLWVKSLQEEFYRQGDKEREMELPISFLCDRMKPRNGPAHGENQLGFLDIIALPLYSSWVDAFPACDDLLQNLKQIRRCWEVDAMRSGTNVVALSIDIPASNPRGIGRFNTLDGGEALFSKLLSRNKKSSIVSTSSMKNPTVPNAI